MKQIIFIALVFFILECEATASDTSLHIPNIVNDSLQSLFPNASNIDWKRKGIGKLEADFVYLGKSISLVFNHKGNLVNYKMDIDTMYVPQKIITLIKTDYQNYKIIYTMKSWEKRRISYEIEVMKGRNIFVLNFNGESKLMEKNILNKVDLLNPPTF